MQENDLKTPTDKPKLSKLHPDYQNLKCPSLCFCTGLCMKHNLEEQTNEQTTNLLGNKLGCY